MLCRVRVALCLLLPWTASLAQAQSEIAPPPVVVAGETEPLAKQLLPTEAEYLDDSEFPIGGAGGFVPPVGYDYYFRPFYGSVDALFLQRTGPANGRTIVQTSGTATPVVDRGSFDLPMVAGPRIVLGKRIDEYSALEGTYFGTHFWRSTVALSDPGNLDLAGDVGLAAADFHQADAMQLSYSSQLHSAEVNYVSLGEGVALLAGVRYLNWLDTFTIHSQNDTNSSIYDLHTTNNLVGGQVGARGCWIGPYVNWDLTGKMGLYGNSANQWQLLTDSNNTLSLRNVSSSGSVFSFVGDVNLNACRRLNRAWQVRAGYNVMLVTGLALAPKQLDFSNSATSGTHLDREGTIFLHGVNVGVDAQW